MPTKLLMPLLGESVTEATVTRWLKSAGDRVEEYEPLLEVNTDKVDTEIPSPTSGKILATLVQEGEVVKVGALLGWIGQPGESIPGEGSSVQETDTLDVAQATPSATMPSQSPTAGRELGFISPVVAKIAAEQKLDLSLVTGTGLGGRITKKDVESYLENKKPAPATGTFSYPNYRGCSTNNSSFRHRLHTATADTDAQGNCRAYAFK